MFQNNIQLFDLWFLLQNLRPYLLGTYKYSKSGLMDSEKKKFDDIRKPLEEAGYEIVKMIGKGAFGEVILVKESTYILT